MKPEHALERLKELAYRDVPPSVRWFYSEWDDVSVEASNLLVEWEKGRDTRNYTRKLLRQVNRLELLGQIVEQETHRFLRLARSLPIKTLWNAGSITQPDGEE